MKFSEITVDTAAKYMRVDIDAEVKPLIEAALGAAKQYCMTYTGLTSGQLDEYEDVPIAALALCSELYDLRQFTLSEAVNINPTTEQILSSYSVNLL